MKPKLLAPRNATREILSPDDAERMLASGSWVPVTIPKAANPNAKKQRAFKARRQEQGYKPVNIYLPAETYEALHARLKNGEKLAELIERLLREGEEKC